MENNSTALLVMDMQMGILNRLPDPSELLKNVSKAIQEARKNNHLVIFVRLGFREGMPEISPENTFFSAMKNLLLNGGLSEFMRIHPDLEIQENDILVDKKRISAFSGSDLEMILRSQKITHLVLTGIATGGIVLSTVREAYDKDYKLTVLSDACADSDSEVHQFLISKIFPKQAEVITVDNWSLKIS